MIFNFLIFSSHYQKANGNIFCFLVGQFDLFQRHFFLSIGKILSRYSLIVAAKSLKGFILLHLRGAIYFRKRFFAPMTEAVFREVAKSPPEKLRSWKGSGTKAGTPPESFGHRASGSIRGPEKRLLGRQKFCYPVS